MFESVPGLSDSRLGGFSAMCRREGQRPRCPHVRITGNEDVAPPAWRESQATGTLPLPGGGETRATRTVPLPELAEDPAGIEISVGF